MDSLATLKKEALIALYRHPLFATLSQPDLEKVVNSSELLLFSVDDTIVQVGDLVDSVYFIVSGRAEVKNKQGQPVTLIGPGGGIGLSKMGLFSTSGLRTATVIALEPVIALRIDLQFINEFLHHYPQVSTAIEDHTHVLERMRFLNSACPFNELSPEELRQYADQINEMTVTAGTILLQEGEKSDSCYLIESGQVEIFIVQEGIKKILATLEAPAIFGETSLLLDVPHNASAQAITETKLLVLNKKLFSELSKSEAAFDSLLDLQLMRVRPLKESGIEEYKQTLADGSEVVILKNTNLGKYFRLSKYGYFIWERLTGDTSLSGIAAEFYDQFSVLDPGVVSSLALDLHRSGFVRLGSASLERQSVSTSWLVNGLVQIRNIMEYRKFFGDADAWVTHTYQQYMWIFFTKPVQIFLLILSFGCVGSIYYFSYATYLLNVAHFKWSLVLLAYIVGSFNFILHELAHAYATKYFGRYVRRFGVGWFWLGPMAFCDTSDMWLANKRERIIVDLAGVYLNLIMAGLAGWIMLLVQSPELIIMLWVFAIVNYLAVMANLNPALELDGYYTLMDMLDRPNLREAAMEWLAFTLFNKKNRTESFWQSIQSHRAEAIFWLVTLLYIVFIQIILTYILMRYLLHGLFNVKNPVLSIVIIAVFTIISLATIWGELQNKRLAR